MIRPRFYIGFFFSNYPNIVYLESQVLSINYQILINLIVYLLGFILMFFLLHSRYLI